MTPAELAAIHEASFETPRPWTADEFSHLLDSRGMVLIEDPAGFLLGRVVADEAEILTLAVLPRARRRGVARHLLAEFLDAAREGGAARAFLEVAATNDAAIALYRQAGFARTGLRRGYFTDPAGQSVDALVLSRVLGPEA